MRKSVLYIISCLFLVSFNLFSLDPQSSLELLNEEVAQEESIKLNSYYQSFIKFRDLSKSSFDESSYDQSYEYSMMAKFYAERILSLRYVKNIEVIKVEAKKYLDILRAFGATDDSYIQKSYIEGMYIYNTTDEKYIELMKDESEFELDNNIDMYLVQSNFLVLQNIYTNFSNSLIIARTTLSLKNSLDSYNEVVLFDALSEKQSDYIASLFEEATNMFKEKDYLAVQDSVYEINNTISDMKNQFLVENTYLLAYATFNNAKKNKGYSLNGKFSNLYVETYNLLYNSQEALSSGNYSNVGIYSMEAIKKFDEAGFATPILPKYYKVRLIPRNRDTIRNISAYEFIYGDGTKWATIYEANKDKLSDANNPNLIYPGTIFEIPNMGNDMRGGTYEVGKEYLIFRDGIPEAEYLEPLGVN